jgi:hypothetical protein
MDHDLIFIRRNRHLPRAKNIKPGLCNYPSNVVNIDSKGRLFSCLCEAWLPWSLGHVLEFNHIDEIWQHPLKREIEISQLKGEYSFCDTVYCNVLHQSRHSQSVQFYIGIDDSCQLTCPSCRLSPIFDKDYDVKLPWVKQIVQLINSCSVSKPIDVLIGSHGDPFASKLYRLLITELGQIQSPIRFQLKTNGLLLGRYLSELNILPKLSQLEISIDAASKDIYEHVRQPGKWENLVANLDYCLEIRKTQKPFMVKAHFVIQKVNLHEIEAFVDLCSKYSMAPNFTVLQDWHTFNYSENAVHLSSHPDHALFVEQINKPKVKRLIGNQFDNWL